MTYQKGTNNSHICLIVTVQVWRLCVAIFSFSQMTKWKAQIIFGHVLGKDTVTMV